MSLSRREFNITAASAAAMTALAPRTFAAEEKEAKKPKLRKAVKYGMIGEGKTVEEKLNLANKSSIPVSGVFDNKTRQEVINFQNANGLLATPGVKKGVADAKTWATAAQRRPLLAGFDGLDFNSVDQ